MDCAIELAHTLNFRKTAEILFISQPSLTYQIQTLEEELGFLLFNRTGKGVSLTPAGEQFCTSLTHIRNDITKAIEQGRNFHSRFTESLTVSLPLRSALYYLPQIMKDFQKDFPHVQLNINYIYGNERIDHFGKGDADIIFGLKAVLSHLPQVKITPLFQSHIYLVTQKEDPLAKLNIIQTEDLSNRTLMIGGGSPAELKKAQELVMHSVPVSTFNSADHMTTLTNIAAGNGVCLIPGFCNDHNGEFAWLPVSFDVPMNCVLGTHADDHRDTTRRFLEIAGSYYTNSPLAL